MINVQEQEITLWKEKETWKTSIYNPRCKYVANIVG